MEKRRVLLRSRFYSLEREGVECFSRRNKRYISITSGRRNATENNDRVNRTIVNQCPINNFHGQNGPFVKARGFSGRYGNPSQKKPIRNNIYK